MDWPTAALAIANIAQVIALAYIGMRQAQVKRDLNGSSDEIQMQLIHLHDAMAGRTIRRSPGVIDS